MTRFNQFSSKNRKERQKQIQSRSNFWHDSSMKPSTKFSSIFTNSGRYLYEKLKTHSNIRKHFEFNLISEKMCQFG